LGVKGMYLDYWMVLFSASCFANMLGLNISSAFNSAVTIYILIPFLIIPQLLLAGVVVKFDKLNPIVAKQGGVPLVGEAMASRWAFEALAVNQFKENAYERNFYKYERQISMASYKKNYWIQKLEGKITKISNELKAGKKLTDVSSDIELLHNEIAKEMTVTKKIKCDVLPSITTASYNDAVAAGITDYLEKKLKIYYIDLENSARTKNNDVAVSLQKTPADKEKFQKLIDNYENESLNQLVKNANSFGEACLEKDGKLIQLYEPVFQDANSSNFGRGHFFAPRKKFLGTMYSTYWFNICVIWLMSVIMIITLYFDVFKKILDFLGNINFGKKKSF
ncbi:MAG: ATP-binding cassette domain-containing protein, partial [Bacteroidia bacterium]